MNRTPRVLVIAGLLAITAATSRAACPGKISQDIVDQLTHPSMKVQAKDLTLAQLVDYYDSAKAGVVASIAQAKKAFAAREEGPTCARQKGPWRGARSGSGGEWFHSHCGLGEGLAAGPVSVGEVATSSARTASGSRS